jgi:hypothetical protein
MYMLNYPLKILDFVIKNKNVIDANWNGTSILL